MQTDRSTYCAVDPNERNGRRCFEKGPQSPLTDHNSKEKSVSWNPVVESTVGLWYWATAPAVIGATGDLQGISVTKSNEIWVLCMSASISSFTTWIHSGNCPAFLYLLCFNCSLIFKLPAGRSGWCCWHVCTDVAWQAGGLARWCVSSPAALEPSLENSGTDQRSHTWLPCLSIAIEQNLDNTTR